MSEWIKAAEIGEIDNADSTIIELDDVDVAVFNLGGDYFAIEDVCTHDGGDISGGWVEGDNAVCPRHLAEFSIRTGEALKGPAYEGVHSFPVRVRDGVIEIQDDR